MLKLLFCFWISCWSFFLIHKGTIILYIPRVIDLWVPSYLRQSDTYDSITFIHDKNKTTTKAIIIINHKIAIDYRYNNKIMLNLCEFSDSTLKRYILHFMHSWMHIHIDTYIHMYIYTWTFTYYYCYYIFLWWAMMHSDLLAVIWSFSLLNSLYTKRFPFFLFIFIFIILFFCFFFHFWYCNTLFYCTIMMYKK